MISYNVKVVNKKTYLWGSAGIASDFTQDFFLFCRVDDFGEQISLAKEQKTNTGTPPTPVGSLDPGEAYIVSLNQISGVYAQTTTGNVDSVVHCTVFVTKVLSPSPAPAT
jgi:hypothetical protein